MISPRSHTGYGTWAQVCLTLKCVLILHACNSSSWHSVYIAEGCIHTSMCNTIKTLHTRNLIPFWSVHGRRSHVKLPRALTQGSRPWIKAARVVHALALSQGPAAASLMIALALPWGQFLLDSMQFLFHKSELKPSQGNIDLCYQSSDIPELGSEGIWAF